MANPYEVPRAGEGKYISAGYSLYVADDEKSVIIECDEGEFLLKEGQEMYDRLMDTLLRATLGKTCKHNECKEVVYVPDIDFCGLHSSNL